MIRMQPQKQQWRVRRLLNIGIPVSLDTVYCCSVLLSLASIDYVAQHIGIVLEICLVAKTRTGKLGSKRLVMSKTNYLTDFGQPAAEKSDEFIYSPLAMEKQRRNN